MNIKGMYTALKDGKNPAETHGMFDQLYKQVKTDKNLRPGEKEFIALLSVFGLCLADLAINDKAGFTKHMTDLKKMCTKNHSDEHKELSELHYDVLKRLTAKEYIAADICLAAEEAMIFHKMIEPPAA